MNIILFEIIINHKHDQRKEESNKSFECVISQLNNLELEKDEEPVEFEF